MPLVTFNVGLVAGISALTFCFQEESVSMLNTADQDKERACGRLNKGFLMTGLFFIGNVVFGGIGFETSTNHPEPNTPLSTSDYFISGGSSVWRLLVAILTIAQILPLVPVYSLKAASFVR